LKGALQWRLRGGSDARKLSGAILLGRQTRTIRQSQKRREETVCRKELGKKGILDWLGGKRTDDAWAAVLVRARASHSRKKRDSRIIKSTERPDKKCKQSSPQGGSIECSGEIVSNEEGEGGQRRK